MTEKCGCGCGGTPKVGRFLKGHYQRTVTRQAGYVQQLDQGRIRKLHQIRAEKALGRPMPVGAQVHHPDNDPTNPEAQIVICPSASYHMLLHARMRVVAAGGNPNTDKICSACRQLKLAATDFHIGAHLCRPCAGKHATRMKQNRRKRRGP